MAQGPRTRLEQHAQTAHLSAREFVDRFHVAAIECGEKKAHISERQAKRWLAGESDLPRPVCCRVLEHWWAEPVSRLFGPPDSGRAADLGHPGVAEEQARAAHTYASVIDHPSLCAWARAEQGNAMYWTDRPRRAASLMATALETAPAGTARARLHSVQARSLALIGARQEVRAALDAAADELQRAGDDPLLDEIGGGLGFDHSRRALCAGTAFVALGDGEQAETEATAALALFGEVPEQSRWVAGEFSVRADLATARILRGDLAGAEDALGPVFALDVNRRTEALTRRLTSLGRMLGSARYRDAAEAGRIGDAIEDFTTRSLPRNATRAIINPAG